MLLYKPSTGKTASGFPTIRPSGREESIKHKRFFIALHPKYRSTHWKSGQWISRPETDFKRSRGKNSVFPFKVCTHENEAKL